MRFILLGLFLVCNLSVVAQSQNNQVEIITNSTPFFDINSIETLESAQTISNCFTVRLRSKDNSCIIFAKYSTNSYPAGFSPTTNPLSITFSSTNSTIYSQLVTTPIVLTSTNQQLFKQQAQNSWYTYTYNLTYGPLGYNYLPGNYSYTITFTMTQP